MRFRQLCGGGHSRPRRPALAALSCAALLFCSLARADLHLKQIASFGYGNYWAVGNIVPYKARADTYTTMVFTGGIASHVVGTFYFRYAPVNRYTLARFDTAPPPTDTGTFPGHMVPWTTADFDGDSEPELVSMCGARGASTVYDGIALWGMNPRTRCLDSLLWQHRHDSAPAAYSSEPFYVTDLDHDGKKEIMFMESAARGLYRVYEQTSGLQFHLVAAESCLHGYKVAVGDFDNDGATEFATAGSNSYNEVTIFKCVGDDRYVMWESVPIMKPNGQDVFSASNLDGSHRSTFFVSFTRADGWAWLYEFAPTQGTHGYQPFGVDSVRRLTGDAFHSSLCADIDGDGLEEVIWSFGNGINVYKCTGPHQYQLQWYWDQGGNNSCNLNFFDTNGNGYPEILETGSGATHIFELEAIKVLYPNSRFIQFHPGDTCRIRWETYLPPRCDSVSLFLRTDTVWSLADTIAHGVSPDDSTYLWTVSNVSSDSCWVVAIAYGPGWQYDESDYPFSILPAGVAESQSPRVTETKLLGLFPNPLRDRTSIRFQLREPCSVTLSIADASGRILDYRVKPYSHLGCYEFEWNAAHMVPGIYFLNFAAANCRESRKLVVTR